MFIMLTKLSAVALLLASATTSTVSTAGGFARPPGAPAAEPPAAPAFDPPVAPPDLPSRADVRAALARRRAHNLAAFHAYWTAGVYPHNTYRVGPLNVWRDDRGHLCAAATMIDRDGQHELVKTTASTNNNIRLLDVTAGPLLDWTMTSGFTLEEIDRIQEPMIEPERPTASQLAAEDAKLKKDYIATEAYLKQHAGDGLEVATDRVLAQPALAWALVRG